MITKLNFMSKELIFYKSDKYNAITAIVITCLELFLMAYCTVKHLWQKNLGEFGEL